MNTVINIGDKFGGLTVLNVLSVRLSNFVSYACKCICGEITLVRSTDLRCGRIYSCGCQGRAKARAASTKHGLWRTKEFGIWQNMIQRCDNPKNCNYKRYGAKGIKVCERWYSFENFIADKGFRPTEQHSIDRYPNKNGNYEPDNARWATKKEQAENRNPSTRVYKRKIRA